MAPYDSFDYPAYWRERRYEDESERLVLGRLFKKITNRGKLIDIGGGYGRLSSVYSPLFGECVVVDQSESLLKIGREMFKNEKNLSFTKLSLPEIDFAPCSFDATVMVRVIHHLKDPTSSIKEINRILKKNGFFILEIANKIHFLARVKALLTGDISFSSDFSPQEKRSPESIKEKKITFINHHPKKIIHDLESLGFVIEEVLSVSNFRHPFLKKVIPLSVLLFLERFFQKPLGKLFYGPSIFVLAKKL